jgi:hypothetical protein
MKLTKKESTKTELPLFNYEFSKFIVLVILLQRREFLEHRVPISHYGRDIALLGFSFNGRDFG